MLTEYNCIYNTNIYPIAVKVKPSLLVTFDFTQRGKSAINLAAGSLLSACKQHPGYVDKFTVDYLSIEMTGSKDQNLTVDEIAYKIDHLHNLKNLHGLALGCYVAVN